MTDLRDEADNKKLLATIPIAFGNGAIASVKVFSAPFGDARSVLLSVPVGCDGLVVLPAELFSDKVLGKDG